MRHSWRRMRRSSQFSALTAANIIAAGAQWVVVATVARSGGAQELGAYSFSLAVSAPLLLFAQSNLRTIVAVDVRERFSPQIAFAHRTIATAGAFAALIAAHVFGLINTRTTLLSLLIAIQRSLESYSDLIYGFEQRSEHFYTIATSVAIRAAAQVFTFVLIFRRYGLMWGIVSCIVVAALTLLTIDLRGLKLVTRNRSVEAAPLAINRVDLLAFFRLALPLGIMAILASLYQNIPRYAIERFSGIVGVGEYSALFYIILAANTAVTALAAIVSTHFAIAWHDSSETFIRQVRRVMILPLGVGSTSIVLSLIWGDRILGLLYGQRFAALGQLLPFMLLAATVWYVASILQAAAIAAGRMRDQAWIHIVVVLLVGLASLVLVRQWPVPGAVASFTLAVTGLLLGQLGAIRAALNARLHVSDSADSVHQTRRNRGPAA